MADGNFNRNILPYNNYRSGVRAGRSAERARAVKLFADMLAEENLVSGADEADRLVQKFRNKLFEDKM